MVWGAIGWGYKSKLVFLCKEGNSKGINSKAYATQVIEAVAVPFLEGLEEGIEGTIFMEDGAKVHLGHAKQPRKDAGFKSFVYWPPSSPDLNPIEKVWRWMKAKITTMGPFPTKLEDLKKVVQDLWDEMDPAWFIPYIERMPQDCQDVIKAKGLATIN
jgi:transposase